MRKQKTRSPMTDPLLDAVNACGLSVRQLARDSGLDHASLIRFISGERSLRLDKADRLATYFGLSLQPDNPKGK